MHQREGEGKLNDSDKIIFNNEEITLVEGTTIKIPMKSSLEIEILARFEPELLMHLRQKLRNKRISFEKVVAVSQQTNKLYTDSDKLAHMLQQNPKLRKLQEMLGLDLH